MGKRPSHGHAASPIVPTPAAPPQYRRIAPVTIHTVMDGRYFRIRPSLALPSPAKVRPLPPTSASRAVSPGVVTYIEELEAVAGESVHGSFVGPPEVSVESSEDGDDLWAIKTWPNSCAAQSHREDANWLSPSWSLGGITEMRPQRGDESFDAGALLTELQHEGSDIGSSLGYAISETGQVARDAAAGAFLAGLAAGESFSRTSLKLGADVNQLGRPPWDESPGGLWDESDSD